MLKKFLFTSSLFVALTAGWFLRDLIKVKEIISPVTESVSEAKEKPLEKYAIENLSQTDIGAGFFEIKESLKDTDEFESFLFSYEFNPNLDGKTFKKTTGQINIPKEKDTFQVVLMFRGYINQETFRTGDGTRNASEYFARNGFMTIAPDFLGYGGSDKEFSNIFETRFQTYVTALSLIKYFESNSEIKFENWKLPALRSLDEGGKMENIFIWGHSNGGQIALTVLEISGKNYPTTLWAPVSKPFPYSVLYYTDQSEDKGKLIRRELAKFEEDYDVEKYSLTNYLDRINAPIQIHQGASDNAVPKSWNDSLVNQLRQYDKDVVYFSYPATDHNMRPNWDAVVERDLEFFRKNLRS
jgi:uncharacterized protein